MEDDTGPQHGATSRDAKGDALAEQLNQTTSPDAGGNVSGTRPEASRENSTEHDKIFEAEEDGHGSH